MWKSVVKTGIVIECYSIADSREPQNSHLLLHLTTIGKMHPSLLSSVSKAGWIPMLSKLAAATMVDRRFRERTMGSFIRYLTKNEC